MRKILYSREAVKQIKKLPKVEVKKVIRKIEAIAGGETEGKMLKGEFDGLQSLRAWPYRIIYLFERGTIKIISVRHRQGAYK